MLRFSDPFKVINVYELLLCLVTFTRQGSAHAQLLPRCYF